MIVFKDIWINILTVNQKNINSLDPDELDFISIEIIECLWNNFENKLYNCWQKHLNIIKFLIIKTNKKY